ncbi:MAG: hypothetical protein RL701_1364 [Pseudomonadota bacterium]
MDQKQFDVVLTDAELRLRRLKMLYEMWFMGIERVEPATPRKELEDMLTRLRKEQVSNTAQRFRLQQLVQRHVSFSTHWRRIGKQIEEGTYQRDLVRARRRAQKGDLPKNAESELDVSYDVDIDIELDDVIADAERAADAAVVAHVVTEELVMPPPTAAPALRQDSPSKSATPTLVGKVGAPRPALPLGTMRAAGSTSVAPPPPPPLAARPANGNADERTAPDARRSHAPRAISPFALPSAGSVRPKPLEPTRAPAPPPPLVAAAASAKPAPPAAPRPAPPAATDTDTRKPRPAPTAQAPQASAAEGGAFSSSDMERIYTQYLAARARNSERTDNVKRDSLEKTIRGMLPQLQQKHLGKKIDFDVVVKDGKVALKPVSK